MNERAENAGFVATLAALEALKLLSGLHAAAQPALIEFSGYESVARPIDSSASPSCGCAKLYRHPAKSLMIPVPPNPAAKLWLFDFDNTLAALEREVDWPGSRRELEAFLRAEGVDEKIFVEIPKGNLPLYAALHTRWLRGPGDDASRTRPPREVAETLLRRASEIIERHELIGAERAAPTPGAIDLSKSARRTARRRHDRDVQLLAHGRAMVAVTRYR